MMTEAPTYRRIRGWSVKHLMGQRLWLGSDHLLLVTSQFLTERYKRFYFPDIQAITVTRTSTGMIVNVALGLLAALFGVWAGLAVPVLGWELGAAIALGVIAGFWAVVLGLNALLGPTCNCFLYTAVHCEEVYCLGRLNRARRVLGQLRPALDSVQGGGLTDAQFDELVRVQGDLTSAGTVGDVQSAESARLRQPLREDSGAVHTSLFALLGVDAVINAVALIQPRFIPLPLSLLVLVAVIGTTVAALIRQSHTTLPSQLRNVTWATFFYVCLIVAFVYIFFVTDQFAWNMGPEDTPASLQALQTGLGQVKNAIAVVFDVLLGAFGIRILREYRNRQRAVAGTSSASPATAPEQE